MLTISKSHVNVIIFVALILCTFFVSLFFLIYVINFISLIDRRFKNIYLTFILIVVYATNNELCIMLAYMFASCMSFLIFFFFLVDLSFSLLFLIRKPY